MQTHLLKLEPPYRFVFDEENGRVGKVIAVLLKETNETGYIRTVSVPIVDMAFTWDDTDLAECMVLCDEFYSRISFETYIHCMMMVNKDRWFPNGFFSVYNFGCQLNELGIRVLFPCEGEIEGQYEVTMKTDLHLGIDKGEYWVENSFGGFLFGGRYKSLQNLRSYIIERRNDYYRSFPQKHFIIRLTTTNSEFQDMIDDINNTPYMRDE